MCESVRVCVALAKKQQVKNNFSEDRTVEERMDRYQTFTVLCVDRAVDFSLEECVQPRVLQCCVADRDR